MSLFIGGLHDGEWHRVERHLAHNEWPKQWSMVKRQPLVYSPAYYMPAPVEVCSRTDHYNLLEFHLNGRNYHVYHHYKLTPNEAFEMLLRGYQHMDME